MSNGLPRLKNKTKQKKNMQTKQILISLSNLSLQCTVHNIYNVLGYVNKAKNNFFSQNKSLVIPGKMYPGSGCEVSVH